MRRKNQDDAPKASRAWYKKKRFVIPIALVALAVVANAGDKNSNSVADDPSKTSNTANPPSQAPKATPEPRQTAIAVKAADLLKEFEDNELGADTKYKDKVVAVSGVIYKVDTEPFDNSDYILRLNGGGDFEITTVDCYDIPNDKLATLKPGTTVTMQGDFKDGGDLGVQLNHCSLK